MEHGKHIEHQVSCNILVESILKNHMNSVKLLNINFKSIEHTSV